MRRRRWRTRTCAADSDSEPASDATITMSAVTPHGQPAEATVRTAGRFCLTARSSAYAAAYAVRLHGLGWNDGSQSRMAEPCLRRIWVRQARPTPCYRVGHGHRGPLVPQRDYLLPERGEVHG